MPEKKWNQKDKVDRQRESEDRAQRISDEANKVGDKLKDQIREHSMPRNLTETKED